MDSNKKKSEQLGMSYGKANQILRKKILFNLICECNKNFCYRCGKEILCVSTMSIEHKEHWLDSDNPVGKFFDWNNIAFSHLKCNCKASRNVTKIIYPKGKKWCWRCSKFKSVLEFPKNTKRNRECTDCYNKYRAEYRKRTGKR